ncbi:hypothetical protein PO587_02935 [Streptomyces gilvifuscus]|uniref:DUF2171 domain-containing protein n=1 Tax=Streptomyces gilvifuscus TaxID=1550617 RepID=A0ABT5FLK9_9ACTN|nr:hypothetical protein [Streptomyces gilvifuscus]MDC2953407.1 hypothetical protein [Streptomyces gilvifuscus]
MNETKPKAWVGDQVYDGDAGKEGIVSDVKSDGTYVLREVYGMLPTWTAPGDEKLEVTVSREERLRRRREES